MISQYFQNVCLGTFGTDRVGTLVTPTSHPVRPIFNIQSCWINWEGLCKVIYNWKKLLSHSESLPVLTQIWSHIICSTIQSWLTFYNRGSQTYSGLVLFQHFDRWACTPNISYDIKAEENNKNIFTNKHILIFHQ